MHKEVLTENQIDLLPILEKYSNEYFLAGGTAIALHIGHRESIDFDLFTPKKIRRKSIKNYINSTSYNFKKLLKEEEDQIHFIINNVKITFFQFPYNIKETTFYNNTIDIPNLITLSAMKAFALGGRGKWKDYVDLYFILKYYYTIPEIVEKANEIFTDSFNSKLFREQLTYFEDIDYSEEVTFIAEAPSKEEIESFLIEVATREF